MLLFNIQHGHKSRGDHDDNKIDTILRHARERYLSCHREVDAWMTWMQQKTTAC